MFGMRSARCAIALSQLAHIMRSRVTYTESQKYGRSRNERLDAALMGACVRDCSHTAAASLHDEGVGTDALALLLRSILLS